MEKYGKIKVMFQTTNQISMRPETADISHGLRGTFGAMTCTSRGPFQAPPGRQVAPGIAGGLGGALGVHCVIKYGWLENPLINGGVKRKNLGKSPINYKFGRFSKV